MEHAAIASTLEELANDLRRVHQAAFLDLVKPTVTLHGWAPSIREVAALRGFAIGHPLMGDKAIRTSEVFFLDPERGLARTLTRWYRLAELTSVYETSPAAH